MKETSLDHLHIRVTMFVENWLGKKIYQTLCISLNSKYIKEHMTIFKDYVEVHFPTITNVDIISNE